MNSLHVDACMTGIAGIWNDRVYAAPVPTYVNFQPNITHLEMLNILIALRLWAKDSAVSSVTLHCDNLVVVQVVNSGKTRDKFLNACIKHIWFITAVHKIDLQLTHIQGHKNLIANSLSRIYSEKGIPSRDFTSVQMLCFGGSLRWTPAVPQGSCGLPYLHYVHFCLYSLGSNY